MLQQLLLIILKQRSLYSWREIPLQNAREIAPKIALE